MVAITQDTTIQPGGIIQIHSDLFPPGARAHVTVTIDQPASQFPTMRSLIGAGPGGFTSPAQIDEHLRAERDSWQR